jgi:hypothetical protein
VGNAPIAGHAKFAEIVAVHATVFSYFHQKRRLNSRCNLKLNRSAALV